VVEAIAEEEAMVKEVMAEAEDTVEAEALHLV
jgi:hypothetical protein